MKKQFFITLIACLIVGSMSAQELKTIKLNAPNKTRGKSMMQTFSDRRSVREYSDKDLSLQDLSDLLWAANGVNRDDGRRTAPTAMNRQEIDIYVVRADGTYLYNAQASELNPVAKGDLRHLVAAQQAFAATAPVCLVIVMNLEKLGNPAHERMRMMAAVDVGNVSENINLFCASVGLATVPRASMDVEGLQKELNLSETQIPLMNNPVGYPK